MSIENIPAASRAATPFSQSDLAHRLSVIAHTLSYNDAGREACAKHNLLQLVASLGGTGELAASGAAQPASPAPLTDEQIIAAEAAVFSALPPHARNAICVSGGYLVDFARAVLALASPQVAPAPVLTPADVERRTRIAFESTNEDGNMALFKHWFKKGLLEGAALAAPVQVYIALKQRDPLREAAILAIGALERIQHATEGDRLEAADGLRDALALTRSARSAPVAPQDDARDAEIERLRNLASICYAGLGAECNLPDEWLDVFLAASNGESFTTEGLLPFTYTPDNS